MSELRNEWVIADVVSKQDQTKKATEAASAYLSYLPLCPRRVGSTEVKSEPHHQSSQCWRSTVWSPTDSHFPKMLSLQALQAALAWGKKVEKKKSREAVCNAFKQHEALEHDSDNLQHQPVVSQVRQNKRNPYKQILGCISIQGLHPSKSAFEGPLQNSTTQRVLFIHRRTPKNVSNAP